MTSSTDQAAPEIVDGWRVIAVSGGELVFRESGYEATENITYLLDSLEDDFDALARVRLFGDVRAVLDVEAPLTTWRSSEAEILELHVPARLGGSAAALESLYGVPVAVYDQEVWPEGVRATEPLGPRRTISEDAFRTALCDLTFGTAGNLGDVTRLAQTRTAASAVLDVLVKTAYDAVGSLANDVPAPDLARALWDTAMAPSIAEAEAFIEAAITHLYPYPVSTVRRERQFTRPPTVFDQLNRDLRTALTVAGRPW